MRPVTTTVVVILASFSTQRLPALSRSANDAQPRHQKFADILHSDQDLQLPVSLKKLDQPQLHQRIADTSIELPSYQIQTSQSQSQSQSQSSQTIQIQTSQSQASQTIGDSSLLWVSSLAFSADGQTLICGGRYEGGNDVPVQGTRLYRVTYDSQFSSDSPQNQRFPDTEKLNNIFGVDGLEVPRGQNFPNFPRIPSMGRSNSNSSGVDGLGVPRGQNFPNFPTGFINFKEVKTLGGHTLLVRSSAMSADGSMLASGGEDRTIRLWNLKQEADPRPVYILEDLKQPIYTVSFSPNRQILAGAGKDRKIYLWNLATGELQGKLVQHDDDIYSIAISPNNQLLASGSKDKTIKLWDLTTGKLLRTLTRHKGEVNTVAFSADGRTLASGSVDTTVKLWNVETGELLHDLPNPDKVNTVAFSADGGVLASGSDDGTVTLWDVSKGKRIASRKEGDAVYAVTLSPTKHLVANGGKDGKIRLWSY